jgi:hypothetical protein
LCLCPKGVFGFTIQLLSFRNLSIFIEIVSFDELLLPCEFLPDLVLVLLLRLSLSQWVLWWLVCFPEHLFWQVPVFQLLSLSQWVLWLLVRFPEHLFWQVPVFQLLSLSQWVLWLLVRFPEHLF